MLILSLNSSYAIIEPKPMYSDYPLDNESILKINLTQHLKIISTLFLINLNGPN